MSRSKSLSVAVYLLVTLVPMPSWTHDTSLDAGRRYYDAREQLAESLTIHWAAEAQVQVQRLLIEQINAARVNKARTLGIDQDSVELIDAEKFANRTFSLSTICTIIGGKKRYKIEIAEQPINLSDGQHASDYYLSTICLHEDKVLYFSLDNEGKVHSVNLVSLPSSLDNLTSYLDLSRAQIPGMSFNSHIMIFYSGFSPLRLFNTSVKDWELTDISADEWHFNLREGAVPNVKKANIRLSRRCGDAPTLVDIEYTDGKKHIFHTKRFQNYFGEWFAAEVEEVYHDAYQIAFTKHILQRVECTLPSRLRIEIPLGTATRMWQIQLDGMHYRVEEVETIGWDDSLANKYK